MAGHIPPLRHRRLTTLYDPLCRLAGFGARFRHAVIAAMPLPDRGAVLDVGCGTGIMTTFLKLQAPHLRIVGVDPDAQALTIARRRSEGLDITYVIGDAAMLPFGDHEFELVNSTLVFHHLADKHAALLEIRRVLKPGGTLALTDFGRGKGVASVFPWLAKTLEQGKENYEGLLPHLVREAGFSDVRLLKRPRKDVDIIVARA